MYKVQKLNISWNDDIDACMTKVESSDKVLEEFFSIYDWDFIRHIFHCVIDENCVEHENKAIIFEDDMVKLCVNETCSQLDKYEFFNVFYHLFDQLIVGANDEHYGIRYETWWQEFTEVSYQLKCKIEMFKKL